MTDNTQWNLVSGTSSEWSDWITPRYNTDNSTATFYALKLPKFDVPQSFARQIEIEFSDVTATEGQSFRFYAQGPVNDGWSYVTPWSYTWHTRTPPADGVYQYSNILEVTSIPDTDTIVYGLGCRCDYWASGKFRYRCAKIEMGDTATPWCGTFEEEREKAIAARGGTYSSRLTLTALRATINYASSGEKFYLPDFAIEKTNVPYINLQWNRALYEAGTFEVQLDADDYSSTYSAFTVTSPNESYGGAQAGSYSCDNYPDTPAYGDETRHGRICTATGHYEVGLVLKTRFITKSGRRYVLLSGLMLDSMLDGWSTHTSVKGTQSVQTALYEATQIHTTMGIPSIPTYQWLNLKLALATADDKALASTIATKDYDPSFSIVNLGDHFRTLLENRNLGLAATCLWNKLKDSSSASMNCVFFIKAGVDRTLQSDNPVLIGCAFGNVASEEVTIDDSSLRDGITGYATYQPDSKNLYALWASENKDMGGLLGAHWTRGYLTETSPFTAQGATTEDDAKTAAQAYGANTLQDYIEERTAELDVSLLSVEEFNSLGLGDLVTVYLDATSTFETMRIVGFSEVCKEGETTRSITLGTKRLTNNVRAAKYAAL